MLQNSDQHYGSISKFLHWLIAVLVFCMLIAGYFMGDISNKTLHSQIVLAHKLTGLLILALIVLRLVWTLINPKPRLPLETPAWQTFATWLVHSLFYVFLILMPLSGWVMSVAAGKPPKLDGVSLSLPIAKNKPLSNTAYDLHSWLAIVIIALISLHVLAAIYHHYVKKDNIFLRMLPGS